MHKLKMTNRNAAWYHIHFSVSVTAFVLGTDSQLMSNDGKVQRYITNHPSVDSVYAHTHTYRAIMTWSGGQVKALLLLALQIVFCDSIS